MTSTVPVSGVPPAQGAFSFDIGTFDWAGIYYLADRTNKGIDMVDGATDRFLGTIPGFVGAHVVKGTVSNDTSGPNGVLIANDRSEAWAGDGDSTVKVVDLKSRRIVDTISTGGTARADEMAYDPVDGVVVVANDADSPPFLTFISVPRRTVLGKIPYPSATNGLEQPVWDRANDMFYQAVPQTTQNTGGQIDQIDPKTMKVTNSFPVSDCVPHGLTLGPSQHLLLGCSGDAMNLLNAHAQSQVMDAATGKIVATITQVGGSDEAWYSPGDNRYYLAASSMTSDGTKAGTSNPVLGIIDAATNSWVQNVAINSKGAHPHSVAADPMNNHAFDPYSAGIGVFGPAT
ncbi:MAG: cytochrome C nitrite reductase [Chloroflexota bacterium]|nr:cytochrome C nitrite reductase [Chloroflexota bacterium]